MSNPWVNFAAIKESVDIEQVLEHYRVRLKRVRKNYLRGLCPLPTHGSQRSRESFGVDTSRNVWACHSASCWQARHGKMGGNILDLVAGMEACSIREAALRLRAWSEAPRKIGLSDQLVSKGKRDARSSREASPIILHSATAVACLLGTARNRAGHRRLVRSRLLCRIGIPAGTHGFSDLR